MAIQKFGLALDWETSGYSVPSYAASHQGISFGAIIFDTATFEPVESLYFEVKFDGSKYKWDDSAQRIHGLTREHLEAHGVTQAEAAQALAELVFKYNGAEKVLFLGHRPFFDIAFTDQLMASVDFAFEYDPIKLDSAAFALTLLGVNKSDEMFDMMGFPPRTEHNALEDIAMTLETIRLMRSFFLAGVSASA